MRWVGAGIRLLMLAAGLVPFTSPREASAALALAPVPAAPLPDGPVEHEQLPEDDTEREEQAAGHRHAARGGHPAAPSAGLAFPTTSPALHRPAAPPRVAADPFRNGLGSPYRC